MKNYYYLKLNQKMIKIRKKIPALIKKRYSEEVDYDFVKIDDIYELLTPALNKYGVDFEITKETSTQKDADGNPVFLEEDNGIWRYEADLELCWINADCPEDRKYTQIHVIGTHEVPEKAKGTAWTYGLKYYLLNRFSIKQGGFEDPDMMNNYPRDEQKPAEHSVEKSDSKKDSNTGSRSERGSKNKQNAVRKQNDRADNERSEVTAARNGNAPSGAGQKQKQKEPAVQETQSEPEKAEKTILGSSAPEQKENTDQKAESVAKDAIEDRGMQMEMEFKEPMDGTAETEEEMFDPETGTEEEYDVSDDSRAQKETGELADGFQPADSEDIPFFEDEGQDKEDEGEFMQNLRQNIRDEETEEESAEDKARNVKCDFGLYSGKTLGEMLDSPKGRESVKWIAQRYRGANTVMKEAAKLLIGMSGTERRAA